MFCYLYCKCLFVGIFFCKTRVVNVMTDIITFWDKGTFCRKECLTGTTQFEVSIMIIK